MFEFHSKVIQPDRLIQFKLTSDGTPISFLNVLRLWQADTSFRDFFTSLFCDCPFSAFRWETPALTRATTGAPFEFVLLNAPGFAKRKSDRHTYAEYFTDDETQNGIVTFSNIRGDATLVVPSPRTSETAYGHLAAFVRHAPSAQIHSLWSLISSVVQNRLNDQPLWLSTAGGGVAWLHVRIDSQPKYYGYIPYKAERPGMA